MQLIGHLNASDRDPGESISQLSSSRYCHARELAYVRMFPSLSQGRAQTDTGRNSRIFPVGGASVNPTIVQALCSVLGAPAYCTASDSLAANSSNSCSIGGALKAYWAHSRVLCQVSGQEEPSFQECIKAAEAGRGTLNLMARPSANTPYSELLGKFVAAENVVTQG